MFFHWTISGSELSCVTTASMAACVWVCGSILICTLCTIRTLKILQPFRYNYDTCFEGLGSNRHLHFFNVNR